MKLSRLAVLTSGCLIAASCGQTADLQPTPGEPLPVKPLLARATPTAEQLLTPPTNARPRRVDGAVPQLPAGTDPEAVANETGPTAPQ
jgi:hypothetical protein